jgi:hypothetical protein
LRKAAQLVPARILCMYAAWFSNQRLALKGPTQYINRSSAADHNVLNDTITVFILVGGAKKSLPTNFLKTTLSLP